jgi:ABC-2 type transport system permease protein
MREVWYLVRKEILQALRDRQLVRLVIIAPILQLVIFGYVASTDVKNIQTVFVDYDKTSASRELVGRFTNSGYFISAAYGSSQDDIVQALDSNKAQVAVVIPRGYARDLAGGETARVQIIVDGTDTNTGVQAQNYAVRIVGAKADEIVQNRFANFKTMGIKVATLDARTRVWYNPELATVNYMVPGLIGMILGLTTVQLTAQAIVKERAAGTLEQLLVTPIKRWQLVLGKIAPFVVLGFLNAIMISVVGILWFGVPLRGSVVLLLALSGVFLFAVLGQGLLVSVVSKTQQQAMVTGQLIMIPNMMLSGFIFPISAMPLWMQWVTYIIPLRYFLIIARGIFLKAANLSDLWTTVAGLAVLGLVTFSVAAMQLSKTLED